MRFESVTAHRFGPFRDETLELAPGMNVVFGRNEAGKSSWHAALYAGLCGMRRGKGAMRKEEKRFAERHKPWDGDEWEIGAVVALEDGRRVELRHDLAGRIESSAEDTSVAGRDYSHEILFDGAPDGSRWLSLNRRSFLATACVRQADILKVRDDPESLQEDMQRAAATAGVDQTAAAELQRLEDVLRERVGSTRAPTKPLMTTARRVAEAREALETAREAHRDFQERRAEVETLERAATEARRRVEAAEAALVSVEAEALAERLREARTLHDQFPDGAPHPIPEGGGLTRAVTEALTTWRNLPAPVELTGPSAREIEETVEGADAELAAARAVIAEAAAAEAEARLAGARELQVLFPDGGPRVSPEEDARLGEIRDALRTWESLPPVEAPAGRNVEELEEELASLEERRRAPPMARSAARPGMWLASSAVVAAGGLVLALLAPDSRSAGLILFAVGAGGVLLHRFARTRTDRSEIALALDVRHDSLRRELASARAERKRYEDGRRHRREAVGRRARRPPSRKRSRTPCAARRSPGRPDEKRPRSWARSGTSCRACWPARPSTHLSPRRIGCAPRPMPSSRIQPKPRSRTRGRGASRGQSWANSSGGPPSDAERGATSEPGAWRRRRGTRSGRNVPPMPETSCAKPARASVWRPKIPGIWQPRSSSGAPAGSGCSRKPANATSHGIACTSCSASGRWMSSRARWSDAASGPPGSSPGAERTSARLGRDGSPRLRCRI